MDRKRKYRNEEAAVNMTPMLDIVFIMLIFFIVSSSFVREKGLDVTESRDNDKKQNISNATKAITIKVCANETILIGERSIDFRSVRANVERKLAEEPKAVVVIEAETEASTGILVKVMDQAKAAKSRISISPYSAFCGDKSVSI